MRIFVGFDDTDTLDADRGTGKLARWFADLLPEGCVPWGVVRQQLLVDPRIPYTSHNSSACVVLEAEDESVVPLLAERAEAHVRAHFLEGSDPGICVASEGPVARALAEFGARAASTVLSREEAFAAARGAVLRGLGGTNDGVIGAAAAVGLTAEGWAGRFVEYGSLRELPREVRVADLAARGIRVCPLDRDATPPRPEDRVVHSGWIRPRLLGGEAVLPVLPDGAGRFRFDDGGKRKKEEVRVGA